MTSFAEQLSSKILTNDQFWNDLDFVSARGLMSEIRESADDSSAEVDDLPDATERLMYSASVFAQTDSDNHRSLAQRIALYSTLVSHNPLVLEASTRILASIGNFPGVKQLERRPERFRPSLTTLLTNCLLRAINTEEIGGTPVPLTDFQRGVWELLPTGRNVAVSAPTSAGKSFVVLAQLCERAEKEPSFCCVYVAPTRALLAEVNEKLNSRLAHVSDKVRVSTIPTLDSEDRPGQVFVLTQERLMVLLSVTSIRFDMVVVDEAQSIGDDIRGMILQDCLEQCRARNSVAQFVFLAPGATGFETLGNSIGIEEISVRKTGLSPVLQNRIIVTPDAANPTHLQLKLLNARQTVEIGRVIGSRGFLNEKTLLAAVALELGSKGASLVYGTGPSQTEKIALQLATDMPRKQTPALLDLSKFIKDHVHPKYSLAERVLHGIAFHYGKMPSLLREAIESAFKNDDIKYLVCTTTLFQGINLPARNVFIDTPTRGRDGKLDAAALWNFAGRAGRLHHDIVGNVFLVNYDKWTDKPLSTSQPFNLRSAFGVAVTEKYADVLEVLESRVNSDISKIPADAKAAAGLMMSRAAKGSLSNFFDRFEMPLDSAAREVLIGAAEQTVKELNLPTEVLESNWTVNPFGQARLLARFRKLIAEGRAQELLPPHPSGDVFESYVQVFARINKYILGLSFSGFNKKLATIGLAWMRGAPLPVLIGKSIELAQTKKKTNREVNVDTHVRSTFEFVEDKLRFEYVQLGKAYVDLLRFALREQQLEVEANSIFDFPLALELGVSSVAGQAFIELGLSRVTASLLQDLIPDSNPTLARAKSWLASIRVEDLKLSKIIAQELVQKGLVAATIELDT
ncbi:DEAD/DEAH box helicase [Undibacterium luofuense]|uniref:DEAD/DEAH box helicase n=1 Tax=Undibacterium luofuense TaxID=2828733 RepID=A0A941DQP8_9BURK|nr:DEAD/DEAH box helicase [Undibacterium luofuense]MBR7782326.1 DEAD/DEAH box helicase [Undibacterium luofuense]